MMRMTSKQREAALEVLTELYLQVEYAAVEQGGSITTGRARQCHARFISAADMLSALYGDEVQAQLAVEAIDRVAKIMQ